MTSNPLPKHGAHKPGTVGKAQGSVKVRRMAGQAGRWDGWNLLLLLLLLPLPPIFELSPTGHPLVEPPLSAHTICRLLPPPLPVSFYSSCLLEQTPHERPSPPTPHPLPSCRWPSLTSSATCCPPGRLARCASRGQTSPRATWTTPQPTRRPLQVGPQAA